MGGLGVMGTSHYTCHCTCHCVPCSHVWEIQWLLNRLRACVAADNNKIKIIVIFNGCVPHVQVLENQRPNKNSIVIFSNKPRIKSSFQIEVSGNTSSISGLLKLKSSLRRG